ncbi:hypothetical protein Asppvi_003902 [Aspergillus pseudoviridinutans]|uniref:Uncharacterized protein n=1 Tax=Aspergillus pseudoviridinutans TaxID=1517512 RepID=A0A9P3B5B6_9EURO|nr:uncharacterized protein Asppvi_003902 [Aspergillus pseudoviridinutans]GIJ85047.1 hypothetical protein Asppvi_003902 [Aspergillus pseudoviridinutans]
MLDEGELGAGSTEEEPKEVTAALEEGLSLDEAGVVATNAAEELGDVTAGTEEAGDDGERLADGSGDDDDDAAGPGLKELGAALLDGGTDDGVEVGTETGIIENDSTGDELPGEGRGIAERDGMTAEEVIRADDEDGAAGPGLKEIGASLLDGGTDDDGLEVGTETGIIENDNTGDELPGTEMTGGADTLPVGEVEGVALGVCTGTDGEATTMLDGIAEDDAVITALLDGVGVKTGVELGVSVAVELTVTVEQISCAGPRSLALSNST